MDGTSCECGCSTSYQPLSPSSALFTSSPPPVICIFFSSIKHQLSPWCYTSSLHHPLPLFSSLFFVQVLSDNYLSIPLTLSPARHFLSFVSFLQDKADLRHLHLFIFLSSSTAHFAFWFVSFSHIPYPLSFPVALLICTAGSTMCTHQHLWNIWLRIRQWVSQDKLN